EVLSCDGFGAAPPDAIPPWDETLLDRPSSAGDKSGYLLAQWFSGYLLHTYGAERFVRFYSIERTDEPTADIARRFESIYGISIAGGWDGAGSSDGRAWMCDSAWECESAQVAIDGTPFDVGQTCDQSTRYRTFALAAETVVELGGMPQFVYVRSCTG